MSGGLKRSQEALEALEVWRKEPLDVESLGVADPQRQLQGVAGALRGVASARQRRRTFHRMVAGLAVAAGVLGVAWGGWVFSRQGAVPEQRELATASVRLLGMQGQLRVNDAVGQVLAEGEPLGVGAELHTRQGRAELAFVSGARTEVGQNTELQISEAGSARRETVLLTRGRVDVEVPRLSVPVVFSVKTPDALVVVHGTRFSVEVDPEAKNGNTQVDVTRGVVTVQAGGQEVWLNAGEHWPPLAVEAPALPSGVAASEPGQAAEPGQATKPAQAAEPQPQHRSKAVQPKYRSARKQAFVDAHQLAEENRLFGVAMAKKKAGDELGALDAVERFLARHPDSVLVQEAHVERFRLFSRLGRAQEAAHYARRYLGDYREGYARQEARDVALESP